jgi:Domain of unknown function (DUF4252)
MEPSTRNIRIIIWVILLSAVFSVFPVCAQDGRVRVDHLDHLATVALKTVEVTLDETGLRAITKLAAANARDRAKLKERLNRLKGVYFRSYEFAGEGQYSEADVEALRVQLNTPGWERIVDVRGRQGQRDEVYLMPQNREIVGFTSISTRPRRLCVINLAGQIDLEEMNLLDKQFGFKGCDADHNRRQRN